MMFLEFAFLVVSVVGTDDFLYFDKSKPAFEIHLSAEDFERGKYVMHAPSVSVPGEATEDEIELAMTRSNNFEGDIAGVGARKNVNAGNIQTFTQEENNLVDQPNAARNAIRSRYRKWQSVTIPYTISSQYSSYSRSRIASAMDEYGKRTCIQFVPRQSERDYVYIEPDDGCYSMVGKSGGRQTVSLGSGCLSKGVIVHELMHSVGFFHEQSRNDRDDYIDIDYDNIIPGMEGQFQKYSLRTISHLGTQYDYGSVMHYSSRAFSRNRRPTIRPKQSGARIGQRRGFSPNDVNKINLLYQCDGPSGVATQAPVVTQRPVVVNPTGSQGCVDQRFDCDFLNQNGWCSKNTVYMRQYCPRSCNLCGGSGIGGPVVTPVGGSCQDENSFCPAWARANFCTGRAFDDFMRKRCKRSCNFC